MSQTTGFCGRCGKPKGQGQCPYCGYDDSFRSQQQYGNYNNYQSDNNYQQFDNDYRAWNNQVTAQNKSSAGLIIFLAIFLGILLIGVSVLAVFLISDNNADNNTSKTETTNTVSDTGSSGAGSSSTNVEVTHQAPVFTDISASSTRGTDYTSGSAVNYPAHYATDGNMATAWSCNRHVELTPTITLSAATKQYVSGIRMTNGYCKNSNTYNKNRIITKVLITYEGGSKTQTFGTNGYGVLHDVPFDQPVETSYVSIKVLETVLYGTWKDIAISEIEVY